jgi:hypothetical protein
MKLSTEPILYIMAKDGMGKKFHLQMGKCLPFSLEMFWQLNSLC